MNKISKAKAGATVANQPDFDGGGFAVKVLKTIADPNRSWETLEDEVQIEAKESSDTKITVESIISEPGVESLSSDAKFNTASLTVLKSLDILKLKGYEVNFSFKLKLIKGISVKGTGLGSSGASVAAAFKAFENILPIIGIDYKFSDEEKCRILSISDFGVPDNAIPSYFSGLTIISSDENHNLVIKKLEKHRGFGYFVLATPLDFGIKTADARKALVGKTPDKGNLEIREQMIDAFKTGNTKLYGKLMERSHDWFVSARKVLYPGNGEVYESVYKVAKEAGSCGVTISGAGPTILAIAEKIKDAEMIGTQMHEALKKLNHNSIVRLVDIK